MAAVRARQMAKQREISTAIQRKVRSDEYLKNMYQDEEMEKLEEKGRARARASLLEEQRIEQLAARADKVRLRTDEVLGDYKKPPEEPIEGALTPYSVLKARRREEQMRRQSNDVREQVSKDLARARALLQQERTRDSLEIARDMKGYGSTPARRSGYRDEVSSYRREPTTSSILKSTRRRFDLDMEDDYRPSRTRAIEDRLSDLTFGRTNGVHRDLSVGSSSLRGNTSKSLANGSSRLSKEVHWSADD